MENLEEVNGLPMKQAGDSEDNKRTGKQDRTSQALDGGYGWVVVLGCFLSHVITGGLERSDGVFFLQFMHRFDQSAQLTAWPGAVVSTVRLIMGPVASAICNRYSVRSSVMVGGIMLAVGCILNGYAPNIYFLLFSQGIVAGLGRGLAYAPGLIILGMYFDKRRGLAAGLGTSGVGVGTFLMVPIVQLLFENFGFQGSFLLVGGWTLNILLVAMMYRPLSMQHRFMELAEARSGRKDEEKAADMIPLKGDPPPPHSGEDGDMGHPVPPDEVEVEVSRPQETNSFTSSENEVGKMTSEKPRRRNSNCLTSSLNICFPVEHLQNNSKAAKKMFHFYLLKNPPFLMYCLSIFLFTMSFKAAFTFIPALVKSKNIAESQAALVLSITGVLDTFGRIAAGLILDMGRLRPYRTLLYNGFMFAVSCVAFFLPSLESFIAFSMLCSAYGLLTGAYVSQKSVILVDILGVEHMASSFGILICFQGMGTLLGPPLSGALRDIYGDYDMAFYLGGALMVAAGILMVSSNVFLKIQHRKRSAQQ